MIYLPYSFDIPTPLALSYLCLTTVLPLSYHALATLISDKTMAIDKKMRTFALY